MVVAFWKQRPVFVTGASGLLGSWLVDELLARGAHVTALLRDQVPGSRLVSSGTVDRITVVRGDLEDGTLLTRALNEYEIDTVFHLGAQTIVGTAYRSAVSTFDSNIRGTWNLLEACRVCSSLVKRVIVASSDKAYGEHDALPYTEDTPLRGRFPYDVSKSCADLLSFSYFYTHRLPIAVTRCGNLYGGGDLNFNRLVPGTIRSVLQGETPIIRSDGQFIRDYFYVCDAVEAYLNLAEQMPGEQIVGEAFNFGTETPVSVLDLVNRILDIMGATNVTPRILNEASAEIRRQFLDCTKARTSLGWSSRYPLEQGLRQTIDWYRGNLSTQG